MNLENQWKKWTISTFVLVNILLFATLALGYLKYGSVDRFVDATKGIHHLIHEDKLDLGYVRVNEHKELIVFFRNDEEKPFRVIGYQSSCRFRPKDMLPFVVKPGQSVSFRIDFCSPSAELINSNIYFHTTNPLRKESIRVKAESN